MYKIKYSLDDTKIEQWMNDLEKEGYYFVSASSGYDGTITVIMHKK